MMFLVLPSLRNFQTSLFCTAYRFSFYLLSFHFQLRPCGSCMAAGQLLYGRWLPRVTYCGELCDILQNAEDIKESASMLIQDNLKNQQQIHTRRQQEKEQVEERLKQKLREKNHQHQLRRRQNVDRSWSRRCRYRVEGQRWPPRPHFCPEILFRNSP